MSKNLVIQLDTPISVSNKGELVDIEILTVSLPNVLNYNLYADIKSIITKSVLHMQSSVNSSALETVDSDNEIDNFPIDLFLASDNLIPISKAVNKYLTTFATWDDNIKVNENTIKKLSISDYNNIIERVSYFLYEI